MFSRHSSSRLGPLASFMGVTLPLLSSGCAIDPINRRLLNNPYDGREVRTSYRNLSSQSTFGIPVEGQHFLQPDRDSDFYIPFGPRTNPELTTHPNECRCGHCQFDMTLNGLAMHQEVDSETVRTLQNWTCQNPLEPRKIFMMELMNSNVCCALRGEDARKLIEIAEYFWDQYRPGEIQVIASRSPYGQPLLLYRDSEGVTMLNRWHELVISQSMADNLNSWRLALATEILRFASLNNSYHQQETNSCGEVAALLAMNNVPEYVRLVSGLSSPSGRVRMAGGQWLEYKKHSERQHIAGDLRPASLRMLTASLYEYANGPLSTYSPELDLHFLGIFPYAGTLMSMEKRLVSQLCGKKVREVRTVDEFYKVLERNPNTYPPVGVALVSLGFLEAHWLAVCRKTPEGIEFLNTNGLLREQPGMRTTCLNSKRIDADTPLYLADPDEFKKGFIGAIVIEK